jgi:hypothetical protein
VRNGVRARSCPQTSRVTTTGSLDDWSPCMDDLVFVILTVAFFAVVTLILKGVERL